jgi:DNA ligase (NAD+)
MTQLLADIPVFADEAEELEFVIRDLDEKYQVGEDTIHPLTGLLVPDGQYDAMLERLRDIKPESDILKGTQPSDIQTNASKITHTPPLTSITKANGTWDEKVARLQKFFDDCCKELGYVLPSNFGQEDDASAFFTQELKIDGASLALYYEPNAKNESVLVRAGLRPRGGIEGDEVTINVQYIVNIPKRIPLDGVRVSIRGEAYVPKSVFARTNVDLFNAGRIDKPFANTRNYVAGSIRQFDEPEITAERELAFKFHGMHNLSLPSGTTHPANQIEKAKLAASWGFETVRVRYFRWGDVEKFEAKQPDLDYGIDGLVIKVNNVDDFEQMGNEGDNPINPPKGALAWKFPDEEAEVCIESIVWQVAS